MKQHEREFFISRIRSGMYMIKHDKITLKIYSPTIEEEYELNEAYLNAYNEALEDGIMTIEATLDMMKERGLWSEEDDKHLVEVPKAIERLKVEAFKARNNELKLVDIKKYLRIREKQLRELTERKFSLQENTCEGIAAVHKSTEFMKMCTFLNKEVYEFDGDMNDVLNKYYAMILSESTIRDLARNEPWRSLWIMNEDGVFNLFQKNDRQLTIDQRNILVWSKMYANVHESAEAPADDVIADDDMLDGWFIIQKEKRDSEKAKNEMESATTNEKIKNAGEVFVMAKTPKDIERVNSMNDINANIKRQQRLAIAKKQGVVETGEFADERMQVSQMSNEQFKGKFGS